MTSKFIQTGDIHIGACRFLDGYLDRHKQVLIQLMDEAYNRGVPLVIAGDLVHGKTTSHEESYLLHWWFSEIEKRKIPTIVISGNHDHLHGEITQLDELQCMPFSHMKIVTWHPDTHIVGDIGFICVPWRSYSSEDLKSIVAGKLPLVSQCKYRVVVLHECLSGVSTDSGFIITKGPKLPSIPEVTYWAVGDIHKRQETNLANGHYAGSPLQLTFGDSYPKGVLEVDLERPSSPKFIPTSFKPLKTINYVSEIEDDAHYKLVGDYEEVIKANKENLVVMAEYDKRAHGDMQYVRMGIVDGLPEYLEARGIGPQEQKRGVAWVRNLLKLQDAQCPMG